MRLRQFLTLFCGCALLIATANDGGTQDPRAIFETRGLAPIYKRNDVVKIEIKNVSALPVDATITIQEPVGNKWIEVIPYLGAASVTKSALVEHWSPGGARKFTWNDERTPKEYKRTRGTFRLVAMLFDLKLKAYANQVELGHFSIGDE